MPVPLPLQPHAIDLHAHFLPERYRAAALAHGQAYPDGAAAVAAYPDRFGLASTACTR